MEIGHAALIGMGAIGTVYGRMLFQKYGEDFAVIADGLRAQRLRGEGAELNGEVFFPRVITPEDGWKADLIIFTVKNNQLEQALEDVRPFLREDTILLTLLNGITAKERIQWKYPNNRVLYGLAIHIDAMRIGRVVVNTENGMIQFGEADNREPSPQVLAVERYLTGAGIEAQVSPDMVRAVWRKWMLNVGCNQVSAVLGTTYGMLMKNRYARELFHETMMEVVALAKAQKIDLSEKEVREVEDILRTLSPNGKTSMLQDVEAKRKTEVEHFAGTVLLLGKKLKVPTPVNRVLYQMIRAKEGMY